MILAAGYGTRLWPLTIDRAKPALPFMNRPLVGYVAEYLARFGCREIIVNLHHRGDSVRAALGDGSRFGVSLHYIEEPDILGTGGALDNAREFLRNDTFIVINGKLATDIELNLALETHRRQQALATLILRRNPSRERYSTVNVRDGFVQGFGSYPESDNAKTLLSDSVKIGEGRETRECVKLSTNTASHTNDADVPLMFTGIQILEPRIFDYIPQAVFSHTTTETYPQAISCGERIAAHVAAGSWYELSTIERYLDTSLVLMRRAGRDVELGENAFIAPDADVREAVLWENARVETGARVRRAVLGAGVRVGAGEVIEDAVVVRAELVAHVERPAKALPGAMRGENFVVSLTR